VKGIPKYRVMRLALPMLISVRHVTKTAIISPAGAGLPFGIAQFLLHVWTGESQRAAPPISGDRRTRPPRDHASCHNQYASGRRCLPRIMDSNDWAVISPTVDRPTEI
jgi:hypothetical protein